MTNNDISTSRRSSIGWQVPSGMTLSEIRRLAPTGFFLSEQPAHDETLIFYDTFDWNLWFDGRLLCRTKEKLELMERNEALGGDVYHSLDAVKEVPPFWWDFNDPGMKELLEKSIKLRALKPVAKFARRSQLMEMRNEDGKIVARARLDSFHPVGKPRAVFTRLCEVLPMRGYLPEAEKLEDALKAADFAELDKGPLDIFFEKKNIVPKTDKAKPKFEIDPNQPARETARSLIRSMFQVVRNHESGLIEDVDTEFLHYYRVSLRKIRSILSLLKGVFPEDTTAHLKDEFSLIAKRTNRLRDLDVYLLNRSEYESLLPDELRIGLGSMFDDYADERQQEQAKVKRYIKSKRYRQKVSQLEDIFSRPDNLPVTRNSHVPIKPFISKRILKIFRKICEIADGIDEHTPDENIHKLRIQCKKIRYLLEFFSSLFDEDTIKTITKKLKSLQDNLGLFNDLSVQKNSLFEYAGRKKKTQPLTPDLMLALGGLITILNQCHENQRDFVISSLGEFTSEESKTLCVSTFKKGRGDK